MVVGSKILVDSSIGHEEVLKIETSALCCASELDQHPMPRNKGLWTLPGLSEAKETVLRLTALGGGSQEEQLRILVYRLVHSRYCQDTMAAHHELPSPSVRTHQRYCYENLG